MTMQDTHFFVYIYGNQQRSNLQIGVSGNLVKREEKALVAASENTTPDPATELNLVYYEHYILEAVAMERERQLKENTLDMTYQLVDSMNPNWLDLSDTLS